MPKRDTPANFHWFITVLCGHRRIRAEVEGTGTSHPWCTLRDTSWNFVATAGVYSLSFFLSSLCRLHQLAFDSKLRPPPIHALAFRSVPPNPLPLLTLFTQNPYWLPMRPTSHNVLLPCVHPPRSARTPLAYRCGTTPLTRCRLARSSDKIE